jgi:hypothetical protein
MSSPEADQREVTLSYGRYLNRLPDGPGFGFWVTELEQGLPRDQLIAGFLGSPKYGNNLKSPAPTLVIQSPGANLITNQNVTFTGQVTGEPAADLTLTAQTDADTPVNVPVDSEGGFSFTTALPLDGSADGAHVAHFQAADQDGNVSTAAAAFTLDTRPPSITVTSPAPGSPTSTNITVTGQVADTLSTVASLQAQVDSGPFTDVAVGPGGAFRFTTTLALDGSADGSHTVHLHAADAVGNTSTTEVAFTLDTHGPTIAIQTPTAGLATNQNVSVSGQVTDTGASVSSL